MLRLSLSNVARPAALRLSAPALSRALIQRAEARALHSAIIVNAPKEAADGTSAPRKKRTTKPKTATDAAKPKRASKKAATPKTAKPKAAKTKKAAKPKAAKKKRTAKKRTAAKKPLINPPRPANRLPGRAPSAYNLFVKERAASLIPPGTSREDANAAITSLASQYRTLSEQERATYQRQADAAKTKQQQDLANWLTTASDADLRAENAWRAARNKRRAAKGKTVKSLKRLQRPRAPNPFIKFCQEVGRERRSRGEPLYPVALVTKAAGERWRQMSDQEKQSYA